MTGLAYRSHYDLLGFRAEIASNSPDFIATLDRLNAAFRVSPEVWGRRPDGRYQVWVDADGECWDVTCQGQDLDWCDDLIEAVSYVEWHLCDQAIARRHDLLHVHGAVLSGPRGSLLLPGASGIGKTTFALALALRGLRLLSDDVVFLRPDTWEVEPFPRAFHVHDDALPRLEPLGLRYRPEDHIGPFLCSTVLGPWERTPGPPLRYVVLPRLEPGGPLELQPLSQAEATLELTRCSKNLRAFPRFGLELIARLMEGVECYLLRRNDDLAAAAGLVYALLA